MRYYKSAVYYGHCGFRHTVLVTRYIRARNMVDAISASYAIPGVKHDLLKGVYKCCEITRDEYYAHMPREGELFRPENVGEEYVLRRIERKHPLLYANRLTAANGGAYNNEQQSRSCDAL